MSPRTQGEAPDVATGPRTGADTVARVRSCWFWHAWSRWSVPVTIERTSSKWEMCVGMKTVTTILLRQQRTCARCGIVAVRTAGAR